MQKKSLVHTAQLLQALLFIGAPGSRWTQKRAAVLAAPPLIRRRCLCLLLPIKKRFPAAVPGFVGPFPWLPFLRCEKSRCYSPFPPCILCQDKYNCSSKAAIASAAFCGVAPLILYVSPSIVCRVIVTRFSRRAFPDITPPLRPMRCSSSRVLLLLGTRFARLAGFIFRPLIAPCFSFLLIYQHLRQDPHQGPPGLI